MMNPRNRRRPRPDSLPKLAPPKHAVEKTQRLKMRKQGTAMHSSSLEMYGHVDEGSHKKRQLPRRVPALSSNHSLERSILHPKSLSVTHDARRVLSESIADSEGGGNLASFSDGEQYLDFKRQSVAPLSYLGDLDVLVHEELSLSDDQHSGGLLLGSGGSILSISPLGTGGSIFPSSPLRSTRSQAFLSPLPLKIDNRDVITESRPALHDAQKDWSASEEELNSMTSIESQSPVQGYEDILIDPFNDFSQCAAVNLEEDEASGPTFRSHSGFSRHRSNAPRKKETQIVELDRVTAAADAAVSVARAKIAAESKARASKAAFLDSRAAEERKTVQQHASSAATASKARELKHTRSDAAAKKAREAEDEEEASPRGNFTIPGRGAVDPLIEQQFSAQRAWRSKNLWRQRGGGGHTVNDRALKGSEGAAGAREVTLIEALEAEAAARAKARDDDDSRAETLPTTQASITMAKDVDSADVARVKAKKAARHKSSVKKNAGIAAQKEAAAVDQANWKLASEAASVTIQRRARGNRGRGRAKTVRDDRDTTMSNAAASRIQAVVRKSPAKGRVEATTLEEPSWPQVHSAAVTAATIIQCLVWQRIAKLPIKELQDDKHAAAHLCVLSRAKTLVAEAKDTIKLKLDALQSLTAETAQKILTIETKKKILQTSHAAIQCLVAESAQKVLAIETKKKIYQTTQRALSEREHSGTLILMSKNRAVKAECLVLKEEVDEVEAAIKIQGLTRQRHARKMVGENRCHREAKVAASSISKHQAVVAGPLALKEVDEVEAAIKIQGLTRQRNARKAEGEKRCHREAKVAASSISKHQAVVAGPLALKEVDEVEAAIKIQGLTRQRNARKTVGEKRSDQGATISLAAVVTIQCFARRISAATLVATIKERIRSNWIVEKKRVEAQSSAAKAIQSVVRGRQQRRLLWSRQDDDDLLSMDDRDSLFAKRYRLLQTNTWIVIAGEDDGGVCESPVSLRATAALGNLS